MTESAEYIPPQPRRKIKYEGMNVEVSELSTENADLLKLEQIEGGLDTDIYGEIDDDKSPEKQKAWLEDDVVSSFDVTLKPKGKRNKDEIVTGAAPSEAPIEEHMFMSRSPEGEFVGYTSIQPGKDGNYSLFSKKLQTQVGKGRNPMEVSFVDPEITTRDPRFIAEAMISSTMVLAESALGRAPDQFTGKFTPEEIKQVDSALNVFAISRQDLPKEDNYRSAVALAGFSAGEQFTDPDTPGNWLAHTATSFGTIVDAYQALQAPPAPSGS